MRKVCIVICDRANHGRLVGLMELLQENSRIELSVVCGGATTINRFFPGQALWRDLADQGYTVHPLWHELEGNLPLTQAKSAGLGAMEYANALHRIEPDIVCLIGDRYQALGAAVAASTLGIPLVHFQGGEVSGSLDERYRHAITKLSDWHVPATKRAADNLARMGEHPDSILTTGCPSSDLARRLLWGSTGEVLVIYHPDTAMPGQEREHTETLLAALGSLRYGRKIVFMWPNIDAGSDGISKAVRSLSAPWLQTVKNWPPEEFLQRLAGAACCVGNSSSFVRDSSFFGTPVVLVGHRQDGRECGPNVVRCECETDAIIGCVLGQLEHGRYPPSDLYGDGHVSERVAERLLTLPLRTVKRLAYVDMPELEQVLS